MGWSEFHCISIWWIEDVQITNSSHRSGGIFKGSLNNDRIKFNHFQIWGILLSLIGNHFNALNFFWSLNWISSMKWFNDCTQSAQCIWKKKAVSLHVSIQVDEQMENLTLQQRQAELKFVRKTGQLKYLNHLKKNQKVEDCPICTLPPVSKVCPIYLFNISFFFSKIIWFQEYILYTHWEDLQVT